MTMEDTIMDRIVDAYKDLLERTIKEEPNDKWVHSSPEYLKTVMIKKFPQFKDDAMFNHMIESIINIKRCEHLLEIEKQSK